MKRREFIGLAGGAALALPSITRAQQKATPSIGFLSTRSSAESRYLVAAFASGLREAGFVEGQNVTVEFRWADGQYDRLAGHADDLVRREVALIVTVGASQSAFAAKAASSAIPIVFVTGNDPVALGLVASLNRPGGVITGVSSIAWHLEGKRLEILDDLLPRTTAISMLVNSNNPDAKGLFEEAEVAARKRGRHLSMLKASSAGDIDDVLSTIPQREGGALMLGADAFLASRRDQIIALAERYKVPAIYYTREFVVAGGLMSYGSSIADGYRQGGVYAGRILKGDKPGDLPVWQPTKFEQVINLKTANALGLAIPPMVLALSDEVIE